MVIPPGSHRAAQPARLLLFTVSGAGCRWFKKLPIMTKNRTKTSQKNLHDVKIWFRDTYKNKNGRCAISLMVYLKNKRVVFPLGISIEPALWDYSKERISAKFKEHKDYNLIIDNNISRITDIFVRYRLEHKELTPELLKKEFFNPSLHIDFIVWLKAEIEKRKLELSSGSYRNHMAIYSKLLEFRKELTFTEIDENFIYKFESFLKNKKKNDFGTVHNALKTLKAYLNIAKRNNIIKKSPFEFIKLPKNKPDRIYLTTEELNKLIAIYEQKTLPYAYHLTLRHFLFGCFTSLRISDLRALNTDKIINDTIVYIPQKTGKRKPVIVRIPLTKPALKLIRDEAPNRLKGNIFKLFADATINRQLKDIAKHAEIDKHITTHTMRHTFATLFLSRTKNIVVLQRLLGHTNINDTLIYAHLLTEDIDREMKVFEDFKL